MKVSGSLSRMSPQLQQRNPLPLERCGATIMTTLLFTISISAQYRGTQEIYSAQVNACNGEKLYHLAEAPTISEALEKIVREMRLQEKNSASFR
jgi:hypothetical protein